MWITTEVPEAKRRNGNKESKHEGALLKNWKFKLQKSSAYKGAPVLGSITRY